MYKHLGTSNKVHDEDMEAGTALKYSSRTNYYWIQELGLISDDCNDSKLLSKEEIYFTIYTNIIPNK